MANMERMCLVATSIAPPPLFRELEDSYLLAHRLCTPPLRIQLDVKTGVVASALAEHEANNKPLQNTIQGHRVDSSSSASPSSSSSSPSLSSSTSIELFGGTIRIPEVWNRGSSGSEVHGSDQSGSARGEILLPSGLPTVQGSQRGVENEAKIEIGKESGLSFTKLFSNHDSFQKSHKEARENSMKRPRVYTENCKVKGKENENLRIGGDSNLPKARKVEKASVLPTHSSIHSISETAVSTFDGIEGIVKNVGASEESMNQFLSIVRSRKICEIAFAWHNVSHTSFSNHATSSKKYCSGTRPERVCRAWNCTCEKNIRCLQAKAPLLGICATPIS